MKYKHTKPNAQYQTKTSKIQFNYFYIHKDDIPVLEKISNTNGRLYVLT